MTISPIELAKELFPETYSQMKYESIMSYYNDWKNKGYSIKLYKKLLITRG